MSVGSLTLLDATGYNDSLSFLSMSTPTGWPLDEDQIVEEELSSAGVDGVRYRWRSSDFEPITLTTLADAATHAQAVTIARRYKRAIGHFGTLIATVAGTSYIKRRVHVVAAQVRVDAGGVYGSGATSGSAAGITCVWALKPMEFET